MLWKETLLGFYFEMGMSYRDILKSLAALHGIFFTKYCDGLSQQDDTKTIKPNTNGAFVASSGDIITDYNDWSRCIAPCKHYHICFCDQRNDTQQALLYAAQNSCLTRQSQKCIYRL